MWGIRDTCFMELVNKTIENFRVFERMCLSTASGMTFKEQCENLKFCQPRFEKSHAELLHMLHQAYSETEKSDMRRWFKNTPLSFKHNSQSEETWLAGMKTISFKCSKSVFSDLICALSHGDLILLVSVFTCQSTDSTQGSYKNITNVTFLEIRYLLQVLSKRCSKQ